MILIYKFLTYQVFLILCLVKSDWNYLRDYACREIMLPRGSDSYASCELRSAQFFTYFLIV